MRWCTSSSVVQLVYLIAIISPWAELHETRLLIEWKVSHVDFTRRFENGRRCPVHTASVMKYRLCQCGHHIFTVGTERWKRQKQMEIIRRSVEFIVSYLKYLLLLLIRFQFIPISELSYIWLKSIDMRWKLSISDWNAICDSTCNVHSTELKWTRTEWKWNAAAPVVVGLMK